MTKLPQNKKCTKCGKIKKAKSFRIRRKDRWTYLNSWCISCEHEYNKIYGAIYGRREHTKEIRRIREKKWRIEHREEYLAKAREQYRRKASNPEWLAKHRENGRQWRKRNTDLFREYGRNWYSRNRAKKSKARREWEKNNPTKVRALLNARRARMIGVGGRWTDKQWNELIGEYSSLNQCLCCGKKRKLTADHVVPISKGGTNTIDNLQPLCRSCNSSKGVNIIDYRPDKGAFARSLL